MLSAEEGEEEEEWAERAQKEEEKNQIRLFIEG